MQKKGNFLRKTLFKWLSFEDYLSLISKLYLWSFNWGFLKNNRLYDYPYFLDKLVKEGDVCIDIGANLGYMGYESTFIDESDFVYGGQAGIVLNVSSVDIDLSYRYSLFNGETADTMGSIILGVNYLY